MTFRRAFIIIPVFALFLGVFSPVPAQSQNADYTRFFETLVTLNDRRPQQSAEYDTETEVLKNRVLDNRNKVVGEVRDVILTPNGTINALSVEFDRLRLGAPVFVNYRDMRARPVTNGYALGFDDGQIETLYPTMLSRIETASGEDADVFSVKSVVNADVVAEDGRKLGKVRNVMFGSRGARALAYSLLRGKSISIPYSAAKFKNRGRKMQIMVSNEQANAMIDYASNER